MGKVWWVQGWKSIRNEGKTGRTVNGIGTGIRVTTDGFQERVPISSLRVKKKRNIEE